MRKHDLIDRIQSINATASEAFLTQFAESDLREYLDHLLEVQLAPHPTARAISLSELPVCRPAQVPVVSAAAAERIGDAVDLSLGGQQMALAF
ncbi:MAG: hypothetical protein BIFFINMI_02078 [Phycisphaerae bacterium]|nr:hypothetical protein [Phycisphaerae bacterium]